MGICFDADVARDENVHEVVEAALLDPLLRRDHIDLDGTIWCFLVRVDQLVHKLGKVSSPFQKGWAAARRPFVHQENIRLARGMDMGYWEIGLIDCGTSLIF